jgi:limonene-1,2-epoxide hydrolase
MSITRDEAVALFERRRDAWLAEDFDAYVGLFANDVVLQTPIGEPHRGREAYEALVRRSYEAMRPVSFDFHEIAVHGDKVLSEWTITVEVRADGTRIPYDGMSICEIRDGLIATWREYFDPASLRRR